jgi:outer membrane scaffolding protein for murein synthesis (MipA/OmpV family)
MRVRRFYFLSGADSSPPRPPVAFGPAARLRGPVAFGGRRRSALHGAGRKRNWMLTAWLLAAAAAAGSAWAAERPLWELGAGAAGLRLPDYRGSDQSRNYLYPIPYVRYRGELLKVDDRRGLAALLLLQRGRAELDVSLYASQPAPSDRNAARQGMPDLDPTLELGPVLKLTLWENPARSRELSLQLPVRPAFAIDFPNARYIGVVFNPVIDYFLRDAGPGGGWRLGLQAGPVFTDSRYNRYYYQVDPAYATAARPAYSASGGYGGTQFTASLSKRFDAIWIGAFVRAYALHGATFEASPLVRRRTSVLAGIGIAYVFAESATRVDSED